MITVDWLTQRQQIPSNHREDNSWIPEFQETLRALREYCRVEAQSGGPNALKQILEHDILDLTWTYYEEIAAAGILLRGSTGVDTLAALLRQTDSKYHKAGIFIKALWRAAASLPVVQRSETLTSHLEPFEISELTSQKATTTLNDLIIESPSNPVLFSEFISVLSSDSIGQATTHATKKSFPAYYLQVVAEASITLTQRVLDEFEALIAAELPEERYQVFLKQNPVLVDPLSAEIAAKHKLGTEYVTDFIIRRHDFRYIAVEIEKPQDAVFTLQSDFAAPFTHAVGQVIDFQRWISANISYAAKKLPSIDNPHGLLIMGMRAKLTADQQDKLRWWQSNSKTIEFLTYDDVLERGRLLLRSLRPSDQLP